jgi:DNA-binding LacI/PurR family transcriptional regulator
MTRVDINAIATACSVSKTTVSKVFTQKGSVSPAVREQILRVAREMNYTPRQVAARETIAIIVSRHIFADGASFRSMVLASLMGQLTTDGLLLKIVFPEDIDVLMASHVKSAIVLVNGPDAIAAARSLREMGISVVCINEMVDDCHAVCTDHGQGVDLAVKHLVQQGHRRIALMLDSSQSLGARQRLQAYQNAIGQGVIDNLQPCIHEAGNTTVVECLDQVRRDRATALILLGESLVNETVYMLDLLRIRVPDDLSVISSEIPNRSRWLIPSHTTIDQHQDDVATHVVKILRDVIAGKAGRPVVEMLPVTLIERKSVRPVSSSLDQSTAVSE